MIRLVSAAALFLATVGPLPAGPPTGGRVYAVAAAPPARSANRPAGPRAGAFVPGLPGDERPIARLNRPTFRFARTDPFPDTLEILFLTNDRPVRVRVVVRRDGKPLADAWDVHVRKLFAGFDRDGNGSLNRYEADFVFTAAGMSGLLSGSYYYSTAAGAPVFEELDRDDDGRVSADEFAASLHEAAAGLLRGRHVPVTDPTAAALTKALFAKLDRTGDGKLSEPEMADAEKLLAQLDKDEDEGLSPSEIEPAIFRGNPQPTPAQATAANAPPLDLQVFPDKLPGVVTQHLVRRYDRDKDSRLTRDEIGLDADAFRRLDRNADGRLDGPELDRWRDGPPDFAAELDLAGKRDACRATVTPAPAVASAKWHEVRQSEPGRVVLRVGKQLLDMTVAAPTGYVNPQTVQSQLGSAFPEGKKFLTEAELVGPQYQFLRIVFDAADLDGDGRLTRAEFDRLLTIQQGSIDLALSLAYATKTPSLFQLMDENGDGRLGLRELRTAWRRLVVLEPTGGPEVTEASIQPTAAVRLGRSSFVAADPTTYGNPFQTARRAADRGPLWFRKMDRNGDGDLSRAEFLGPRSDFDRIDANRDGLLAAEEAEAFDKTVRVTETKKPAGKTAAGP